MTATHYNNIKALSFLAVLLVPVLAPAAHTLRCWWLSPFAIFVVVPLADWLLGEDRSNEHIVEIRWPRYFATIPRLYLLAWASILVWSAATIRHGVSSTELVGLLIACSAASAFATCASHELLHRPNPLDQALARLAMALCGYGHFVIEHLHHHATVGIVRAGTVPKPGESVWSFVLRNVLFSYANAYRIAERMRKARSLPWYSNRACQQGLLTLGLIALAFAVFGAAGLLLFIVQAFIAQVSLELIQFFEHHGLIRQDGEPVSAQLSWNANGLLTNALTFNIARHSHHHLDASVPYQSLRLLPDSPMAPMGYFGMTWLAVVPAIWRRVI